MLAGLNPLGVVAAAIFVAGVLVGADSMSRGVAVPTYIADVIVAISLLSMLVATAFAPLSAALATERRMLADMLDSCILANADFWVAVLRIATPLIFGTLGVLLCERAGVLNLGIEGIMVAGALAGWLAVYLGAGLWIGVLAAALAGAAFGLLHALLTVPLALSQHVAGLGDHAVRDQRLVLRVPGQLSQRDDAADDPAVRRNDVARRSPCCRSRRR